MKPISTRNSLLTASLALVFAGAYAHAAITIDSSSWTRSNGVAVLSGQSSTGLTVGNNTAENADDVVFHASIDANGAVAGNQAHTLAVGDRITFTGTVNLSGIAGGASGATSGNQFRIGLFNTNSSPDNNGWLGYILSTGSGTTQGSLRERDNPNTALYTSTTGATTIASLTAPNANTFNGLYNFSFSLNRISTGMEITSSFVRQSNSLDYAPRSTAFLDTTISTFTFDRIGFTAGGGLDLDQVVVSNLSIIPEPSAALLGGLGMLLLLRRRR